MAGHRDPRIQELRSADRQGAVRLWVEAGLARPWNDPGEDFHRAVAGATSAVLGIFDRHGLSATVMVGHDGHRGWVYYLAVRPERRGSGLGRLLMRAAEDWLRDRGAVKLNLMVRQDNTGAVAFYEKVGYETADVTVLARWLQAPRLHASDRVGNPVLPDGDDALMHLRGDRVLLRPVERADVPALVALLAEPAVAKWWHGYDHGRVERELLDNDDVSTTVYVIDLRGSAVGVIQSSEEPDPDYRRASIDIAVTTTLHGTGVAVDALHTLARHLIDDRGHHHLTIDPAAGNARAIACYAKVGFRPVGVLRRNERGPDRTFHDTLLMDLLAPELHRR